MKWRIAAIVLAWPISTVIVFGLLAITAHCQVLVSMDLISSKGSAPLIGKGIAAYTWNLHACSAGPLPVPFDLVRMNFPEVRLYSLEQQSAILSQRVSQSWPVRIAKYGGYGTAAAGVTVQAEAALKKSPSQLGTVLSIAGLAIPAIIAVTSKDTPHFVISNPVPAKIDLGAGNCADYTNLATFGKAAVTLGPRRVDPIQTGVKP